MRQINLNVTPEFARDLRVLMKARNMATQSEAIRKAVQEAAGRSTVNYDYHSWLGMANKYPENKRGRFLTEDDLWS